MTITKLICKKCDCVFGRAFNLPKSIDEVVQDIEALECPECKAGNESIAFYTEKKVCRSCANGYGPDPNFFDYGEEDWG